MKNQKKLQYLMGHAKVEAIEAHAQMIVIYPVPKLKPSQYASYIELTIIPKVLPFSPQKIDYSHTVFLLGKLRYVYIAFFPPNGEFRGSSSPITYAAGVIELIHMTQKDEDSCSFTVGEKGYQIHRDKGDQYTITQQEHQERPTEEEQLQTIDVRQFSQAIMEESRKEVKRHLDLFHIGRKLIIASLICFGFGYLAFQLYPQLTIQDEKIRGIRDGIHEVQVVGNTLMGLQRTHDVLISNLQISPYEYISVLSEGITGLGVISTVLIEEQGFTLEIVDGNAAAILQNLEGLPGIAAIAVTSDITKDDMGRETFTLHGEFLR